MSEAILTYYVISVFLLTITLIIWRPFGMNESVPAALGAILIFISGIVSLTDVYTIFGIVSGAAVTILSTIVMSIVLQSVGVFQWAAFNIANRAGGSGRALFWYINLLCFLMTLFFNNDGSILITTPIIIQTLSMLNLKAQQQIPYLLSGVLVATGASAPIGVSNLANLIALKIVGLDLNSYASMMFVPSMIGLITMTFLIYLLHKKEIPVRIPMLSPGSLELYNGGIFTSKPRLKMYHPLTIDPEYHPKVDWSMFRICIVIVVLIRVSFFALSPFGIPTEWPALVGAFLLIAVRWHKKRIGISDIARNTPWHILIFAFSTYLIIFGINKAGLTTVLINQMESIISDNTYNAVFGMGLLLTVMSNLCNNLPSIMIGTLALTEMNLDVTTMQAGYLASVIGADIGSLMLPMGTLASLIWMFILRSNRISFSWLQYLRTTIVVIPLSLFVSLTSLYLWLTWIF